MRIPTLWKATAVGVSLLLLSATAVWADGSAADNDTGLPGNQNTYTVNAAAGAPVNLNAQIVADYSGSKHLNASQTVVMTVKASGTTLPAGYSVGVISISIPSNWGTVTTASGTGAVSFTAPAVPGPYSYTFQYDALTFTCASSPCFSGNPSFTVNLTVDAAGPVDTDGDGVPDTTDNCPNVANADQADADNDGIGDACEADSDGDGVIDDNDNCPEVANADQADADDDVLGNACDSNSYPPVLDTAASDANRNEGDLLQAFGKFTDADGNESLIITADNAFGTFTDNGDGTWDWSYTAPDDISATTITVTASDGEHADATDSFAYSAANVAPDPALDSLTGNSGTACIAGNTVTLGFSWTDPAGTNDTYDYGIDWGDGSTDTTASNVTSPVTGVQHTYVAGGPYTIVVTVNDEDGGSDNASSSSFSFLYNVSGVLQPVNDTQAHQDPSIFKYGSTIPVKISVTDCNGVAVSGLAPRISVQKLSGLTPSGTDEPIVSTSGADTGTTMRWSAPIYIYNLATKSLPDPSAKYRIFITGPFVTVTADFGTKAK